MTNTILYINFKKFQEELKYKYKLESDDIL